MILLKYNVVSKVFGHISTDEKDNNEWHTICVCKDTIESTAITDFLFVEYLKDKIDFPRKIHLIKTCENLQRFLLYLKHRNFFND